MLFDGLAVVAVVERQDLKPEAIRDRRRRWLKKGMASLPDQPRCGVPTKLTDSHRNQLKDWVDKEPLTCRVLLSRLVAECGVTISANTLRNELKRKRLFAMCSFIVKRSFPLSTKRMGCMNFYPPG